MYVLFLDESFSSDLLAVGGVAVPADQWPALKQRWTDCFGKHVRKRNVAEFKWAESGPGRGGSRLAEGLCDVLASSDVTCFLTLVSPREAAAAAPHLFGSAQATYATSLMFIAERYQRFLDQQDTSGMIVIDQRSPHQDEGLRVFFARLQNDGTPYSGLDRIIDPLLLSPSHHSVGIQAADLVVGPAVAVNRADVAEMSDARRNFATRLYERLLPCFARHPATGEVDGVGIKRFPDDGDPPSGKLFQAGTAT